MGLTMKKIFVFLILLIPTVVQARSIDSLLTVAAGGMYFILQKGGAAYFCPALDPSKVMDCRRVKGKE